MTVIAPNGITADSMTKAVSVLPPEQALKLVEDTPGAAAYIVILDKDEKPIVTAVEAVRAVRERKDESPSRMPSLTSHFPLAEVHRGRTHQDGVARRPGSMPNRRRTP